MFPADFAYARAASVDEALDLLYEAREAGQEAKVIAGGQSLLPVMKLRLAAPEVLIDLAGIRELSGSGWMGDADGDGVHGAIGALTTYRELERHKRLIAAAPAIGDALAVLADPQVRARGTIGGAVAHGDPSADLPAVLLALDADVTIASRPGTRMRPPRATPPRTPGHMPRRRDQADTLRAETAETQTIPLDSFLQGVFTTDLAEDEILSDIGLHIDDARGSAYEKFPHPASHLPLAGVAAVLTIDHGRIGAARVVVTGIAPRPYRARRAEELLAGAAPVPSVLAEAAATVAQDVHLLGDQHASADYRAHLARVLARRVLATAAARAAVPAPPVRRPRTPQE